MTITNGSPVRGSRLTKVCWNQAAAIAQGTTVEAIGQSDVGMPMRGAGKFIGMFVQCEWAGGSNAETITFTAYKGAVASGNKVYETVLTQTGAASGTNVADNTTPAVSEAVCTFADGDDLILTIVTSASTGNIVETFVALDFEASIFA